MIILFLRIEICMGEHLHQVDASMIRNVKSIPPALKIGIMSFELPSNFKFWLNFVHPMAMWGLFAMTIYALYLGIKVKRTRQADAEKRKELIKGGFNQKHYLIGSLLLAIMVLGTLGGMAVTYINNGKLFVGSHLLVGLGMTGMIAVSAALSPLMQKGKSWARTIHVAINMTLVLLFGWQAFTGLEIVQRIISKATSSAA
jgi:hypothetical protein